MGDNVPLHWTKTDLSNVVDDYQSGFASGNKDEANGLFHLRMNNISNDGRLNLNLLRTVPTFLARPYHYLQKGDLLICTTNSAKLVGKSAIFDKDGPYAFSNHLTRVRVRKEVVYSRYLFYYLLLLWQQGGYELLCKHWVNQSTLSKENLLSVEIPLAPLSEQNRIVNKLDVLLSKVNACKTRLEKIPAILKRFRHSVLAAACSGRLTADWREQHQGLEIPNVKETISRGEINNSFETDYWNNNRPDSWSVYRLAELSELVTKGSSPNWQGIKYVDHGVLFVTSENIGCGHLNLENKKYLEKKFNDIQKRSILKKGDLLTNIVGASIGRTALYDINEEANINQAVCLVRLRNEISKEYVLLVMNSPIILDIMHQSKVDVARANLSLKDIADILIPLPSKHEQHEIVRRVEALFKIADDIERSYEKAKAHVDKLTQSILARAFRGELVPQDPNDEPASELLKSIQQERASKEEKGSARSRRSRQG